jgi:hypothetical protein
MVDKACDAFVMNKVNYIMKMRECLSLSGIYRKLSRNPFTDVMKEVRRIINESNLYEYIKKYLTPSC